MAKAKKKSVKTAAVKSAVSELKSSQVSIVPMAQEVNEKLIGLQRQEEDTLVALLKENEAITRNTVSVEMEIKRQKLMTKDLSEASAILQKELDELTAENTKLIEDKKELEKDVKELHAQNNKLKSESNALAKSKEKLENEQESLNAEVERLDEHNDKLKQDVARLQKLKEDYLKSIAKFKEMREDLIP